MAGRIAAYLSWGVQEVIVVMLDGKARYHRIDGVHDASGFGLHLEV